MHYPQTIEEAIQIARVALPLASKHNIAVNPVNYAVLFEHIGGQNVSLSSAFCELEQKDDGLNQDALQNLYLEHIATSEEEALEMFRQQMGKVFDNTQGSIDQVQKRSDAYSEHLGSAAQKLSDSASQSGELSDLVAGLLAETEDMQSSSSSLKDELASANAELAKLREDFEKVRKESLIDPLTGVSNRRGFDGTMEALCSMAEQGGQALMLLIIDLDHFKQVNDTYGHIAGDAILKWVARTIKMNIRGGDAVARFGGEEFAVLLPDTDLIGAEKVAENIRAAINSQQLKHGDSSIGKASCSIGVAPFVKGMDAAKFIEDADEAMYHAKHTGRNRVCVYGNLSQEKAG